MTLAGIAVQARLLEDWLSSGQSDRGIELVGRIAEQLEAMAKRRPPKPIAEFALIMAAGAVGLLLGSI
jgi:hypothetical protein